jgi:hypothetical protein
MPSTGASGVMKILFMEHSGIKRLQWKAGSNSLTKNKKKYEHRKHKSPDA